MQIRITNSLSDQVWSFAALSHISTVVNYVEGTEHLKITVLGKGCNPPFPWDILVVAVADVDRPRADRAVGSPQTILLHNMRLPSEALAHHAHSTFAAAFSK